MSTRNALSIVICDFNGWSQTRLCLEALKRSRNQDFEIIVVDHGTDGETERGLADCYPEVHRIPGDPTLWWSGATNLGIRTALRGGADRVMLLNNDCYVSPHTMKRLMSHAPPRSPAIIAPLQRDLNSDRLLVSRAATTCFLLGFPTLRLPVAIRYGEHRLLSTGLILGGRGALIPAQVFDRIGLLNEVDLPHYWADHDFYLRCRQAGVGLYLALDAIVDIDDTRTSRAAYPARMNVREFLGSFTDPRSHRNLRALSALFRSHYPIPGLHYLGVGFNVLRYALSYTSQRTAFLARGLASR